MASDAPAHVTHVRVRYGEVDRMDVVYHAHYLVYFEQGRTEYLRALGGTYRALEASGTLLMVVETGVRHLAPGRYDDHLTILTRLVDVGRVRLRFEYEVRRDEEVLATGFTVLACTSADGRPQRLPEAFLGRIATPGGKARPAPDVGG